MEIGNYKMEEIKDSNCNFLGTGFIPKEELKCTKESQNDAIKSNDEAIKGGNKE